MHRSVIRSGAAAVATFGVVLAACGSGDGERSIEDADGGGADTAEDTDAGQSPAPTDVDDAAAEAPTIVVTTNVLGDVVGEVVGDAADVVTVMPVGADPHDFQASAEEVDTLMNADALIVNGAAFEEGLLDVIENAVDDGIPTFEAISVVETIEFGEGEHADDDEHADEDGEHDDHDHAGADPHFFTDPMRMIAAVDGIVGFLQDELEFVDTAALQESADAYVAELRSLDADVAGLVDTIPDERRVLVTNHDVFGYFADRYGFEVVGVVVPGGSTTESVSAGDLAELAEVVVTEAVPAIFTDNSASDELAATLADEVGDIAVVTLYTGSLGEADSDGATYLGMVRSNAERISAALA